jgi:hypothetical protein
MARKTWVLDTDTKGTGANVVPLDKTPAKQQSSPPRRKLRLHHDVPNAPAAAPVKRATPLPPGHVRKKATGEIGKIQAIDPRAGTATVRWLKSGTVSTVPISSVSRS